MNLLALALTCSLAGPPVAEEPAELPHYAAPEAELPPDMVREAAQPQPGPQPGPQPQPATEREDEQAGDGTGHIVFGSILIGLTTGAAVGAYFAYEYIPVMAIGPVIGGAGLGTVGGLIVRKGVMMREGYREWGTQHGVARLRPTGGGLMVGGGVLAVVGFGTLLGGLFAGELGTSGTPWWPAVGVGGAVFVGGVTMLGTGMARNKRWRRWRTEIEARPAPIVLARGAGLSVTGRF